MVSRDSGGSAWLQEVTGRAGLGKEGSGSPELPRIMFSQVLSAPMWRRDSRPEERQESSGFRQGLVTKGMSEIHSGGPQPLPGPC